MHKYIRVTPSSTLTGVNLSFSHKSAFNEMEHTFNRDSRCAHISTDASIAPVRPTRSIRRQYLNKNCELWDAACSVSIFHPYKNRRIHETCDAGCETYQESMNQNTAHNNANQRKHNCFTKNIECMLKRTRIRINSYVWITQCIGINRDFFVVNCLSS